MLHYSVVTAPVCVADKDIGFGFVAVAVVAVAVVAAATAAAVAVAGADVDDAVAGCVAVVAAVATAVATAAVAAVADAAGPVFVAQCQPPRKKIRRGQRSRYETPVNEKVFHAIAYIQIIHIFLFKQKF